MLVQRLLCAVLATIAAVGSSACHSRDEHGADEVFDRAAPLIAAIEQYQRLHGEPPEDLGVLIPRHLRRIPRPCPFEPTCFGYARTELGWQLSANPGESGLVYLPGDDDERGSWAIVCIL